MEAASRLPLEPLEPLSESGLAARTGPEKPTPSSAPPLARGEADFEPLPLEPLEGPDAAIAPLLLGSSLGASSTPNSGSASSPSAGAPQGDKPSWALPDMDDLLPLSELLSDPTLLADNAPVSVPTLAPATFAGAAMTMSAAVGSASAAAPVPGPTTNFATAATVAASSNDLPIGVGVPPTLAPASEDEPFIDTLLPPLLTPLAARNSAAASAPSAPANVVAPAANALAGGELLSADDLLPLRELLSPDQPAAREPAAAKATPTAVASPKARETVPASASGSHPARAFTQASTHTHALP